VVCCYFDKSILEWVYEERFNDKAYTACYNQIMIKKCKICDKKFTIEEKQRGEDGRFKSSLRPWNTQTCSPECRYKNTAINSAKSQERRKKRIVRRKCRYCGKEVVSSAYCIRKFCEGKAGECYRSFLSETRKGKDNPAYKSGFRSSGKRGYAGKHTRACAKYRKHFLEKNEYLFCEVCGVNENGTPRFETHHIYFASLYPKHEELHNFKNLIMVCIACHNKFHGGNQYRDEFLQIEKERGLKELFKK